MLSFLFSHIKGMLMFNTNSISYISNRYLKKFFSVILFHVFCSQRDIGVYIPYRSRNGTVSFVKLTLPSRKRTEPFIILLNELISQATPPKLFHWLFKTKRIRQNDFVSISLISNFIVVDILLEHILTLFHFGFDF